MQSHQSADTFQKSSSGAYPQINLFVTEGSLTRKCKIVYKSGRTTSFDKGFDGSIFGGGDHSFAIYTEAVANSQGRKLGIQSLPNSDYENMVVPVGVNAMSGKTITITAQAQNLPEGINVFLEDKNLNTFTQLTGENANYQVELTEDVSGIGRFYIHTTSSSLSIHIKKDLKDVSLYKHHENIRLRGVLGEARILVYTILGQQILQETFTGASINDIPLPKLNNGIYIVRLETEKGSLSKKIVLE